MKYNFIFLLLFSSLLSCVFSQKIKDGETAYERKQFAVAIDLLEKEYESTSNETARARKAFILGKSYLRLLEYDEAKEWFKKAVDLHYGAEAYGNLANTYKSLEEYDAAIGTYKQLADLTGKAMETQRDILVCKQAIDYKKKQSEYHIDKIFENTSTSEYSPVLYENDFLVFTSERKEATGSNVYNWTGEKFSDLFIMMKTGSEIRKFDSSINTDQNEGSACFSKDMNTMYFTRCFGLGSGDDYCKLMVSKRDNGVWTEAEMLPFIQEKVNYGQATLIENDSILVFAADIEEPGGPTDLYYAEMMNDGSWSAPEKFPSSINTQGNEKFPTHNNDTMYFSSDFLPGLGGYDIFKTFLRKDGSWSVPINLGYPINSGGDDFSFIIDNNARLAGNIIQQGFFTSSRKGSGKDDIYKFSKIRQEVKPVPKDSITETKKSLFVTVKTLINVYEVADNPNSRVVSQAALGESLVKIVDDQNVKILDAYSDKNGFYFSEIPADKNLKIIASKLGYLNASKEISTKNIEYKVGENVFTINVSLVLNKIYTDKEINLQNIYYDYDKWDIKQEAKPTLDELVKILDDNPQINIQLSSHTDCRGTEAYNEELSQKRAQSVVDYLISKSISPARLIAKGYGESQLIELCECEKCTEAQHQANRRTTFKILKR